MHFPTVRERSIHGATASTMHLTFPRCATIQRTSVSYIITLSNNFWRSVIETWLFLLGIHCSSGLSSSSLAGTLHWPRPARIEHGHGMLSCLRMAYPSRWRAGHTGQGMRCSRLPWKRTRFRARTLAEPADLMARAGHDSEPAAMIFQHESRGAVPALGRGRRVQARERSRGGLTRRTRPRPSSSEADGPPAWKAADRSLLNCCCPGQGVNGSHRGLP